jgi:hypothetical protein
MAELCDASAVSPVKVGPVREPYDPAISDDFLSAVISIRYILSFRKDNPNVFNMLAQNRPVSSGIKCICY